METYLKRKREERGLSQSELAEMCEVSLRTLQEYEQGRKSLSAARSEVVYKFSHALNCDIENLIIEPIDVDSCAPYGRISRYLQCFQDLFILDEPRIANAPFDDVFKTISIDCSELLIPLINEAFGEHYRRCDLVVRGGNEHATQNDEGEVKKRFTDSNFVIVNKDGKQTRYQIECQSSKDSTILLRIFEYAGAIAIEDAIVSDNEIRVSYPRSAIVYLRHNSKTPDRMRVVLETPGGELDWEVPVIKTQTYSLDEIFEKELYMLIPYYILVYENVMEDINADEGKVIRLREEFELIMERLNQALAQGKLDQYNYGTIRNMCKTVISYCTQDYSRVNKEVLKSMGGQVLDYETKQWATMFETRGLVQGRRQGRREGKREGRLEGILEGNREGRKEVLSKLLEAGIIDEDTALLYGLNDEADDEESKDI